MSKLFSPFTIKNVTLKNRIAVSPMCQYSSVDGYANDWHLVHLGSRAVGGAALVFTEATSVSPEGRITPDDLGLWSDDHIEGLRRITAFINKQGSLAGIQLAHAGRKASCSSPWKGGKQLDENQNGWKTIGPASIPFQPGERAPVQLDKKGIRKVIDDFRSAAGRAGKAGFNVIEIHSAHGYLLQEFLSPVSNTRTDEYGGTLENRARLLIEIVEAVRSVWPSQNPLFVRISSTDWKEGGWTIGDSVKLASLLKDKDVDLVDCSSGGNVYDAKIPVGPGYQVPFAEAVRKTGILTGAVGFITDAIQAEKIIAEEKADIVLLARQELWDPYFPLHSAWELKNEIAWPVQYLRAKKK